MNDNINVYCSPLDSINFHFADYVKKRKAEHSKHMVGNNITDYAYASDLEHRKKLDSIPGLYSSAKRICSTMVSQQIQKANMNWLAVGPGQFPEIYQIGCECAKQLGIGVPNIFVDNTDTFNAYTVAADDIEPFIVVCNLAVERLSIGELKAMIGHECGHIHNAHTLYGMVEQILSNAGLFAGSIMGGGLFAQLQTLITSGIQLALNSWSRAAEVTADRAALICSDTPEDMYNMIKKLLYGGIRIGDKINTDLEIESLKQQMETTMNNASSLYEMLATHPLSIKRYFAAMEFAECSTFHSWRPDLKKPGQTMRSKTETDKRCKKYIDVIKGKGGR